jgi:colanic acid biosynthesis glycosyl transferase WcaI
VPAPQTDRPLRVQLWSYNYDPEPTGIGPVSKVLAEGLADMGHELDVVAAHPHYPAPEWGTRITPYRETRGSIPVLRLPLWIGRETAAQRYRQEVSYVAALTAALPFLGRPDVIVSASPSFPALLPAIVKVRRRTPWLLWLHDILPDGAMATGLVDEGMIINLSRRLEAAAYRRADRIVVLSRGFADNLASKGVPDEKVELIYDPATRTPSAAQAAGSNGRLRVLSMGNIGFSQGLAPLVGAFEDSDVDADLVITGTGVAFDDVASEKRTERVQLVGLLDDDALEQALKAADVGTVTQYYEGDEFNIPSKLMNFMAYGLPVLAAVNPEGEVARLVNEAGAGWVVDSADPSAFPRAIAEIAADPAERERRGAAAREFAEREFSQNAFFSKFDAALQRIAAPAGRS